MDTILQSIELLSKEKGIDPQIVFDAVKDAMLVAARKHFKSNEDLVADLDHDKGGVKIYAIYKVVEQVQDPGHEMAVEQARKHDPNAEPGGEVRVYRSTESLGRISAQTAKQVILQKVREAERDTVYSEYANRMGELVNCTVKRIDSQDLICDLGKTEARLPKKEQSRLESYNVADRVRCVIKTVEKAGKNAGVIISRAAPELVERLFEQEVPEIYDGTVQIRGCAREAGERTKIAVSSRDRDVDCVGACVGMKGMRVQSIIRELRGEKIDIIEYSEDPVVFATHALSPAKISRVSVLSGLDKHMEVIVDDSQLSLAIGKKGQNVRLASKLLGWRIDIKSEEEKRQEVESQMAALTIPGAPISILIDHGLSERIAERLMEGGIPTVERLTNSTQEEFDAAGITDEMVGEIQAAVNSYYGVTDEEVQAAAAAGEEPVEGSEPLDGAEPLPAYEADAQVVSVDEQAPHMLIEATGGDPVETIPQETDASMLPHETTVDDPEDAAADFDTPTAMAADPAEDDSDTADAEETTGESTEDQDLENRGA
ncbi:MAG: transcription termination/antitermination protein NusA [Bryobacterales bacterium]|nr:transcription termination/antitermination protein NusA [Bryobacterales bacterium]